jgi:CHAD domain-containing protein
MKPVLRSYYSRQEISIGKKLSIISEGSDPAMIHQMRVGMKKLASLISLVEFITGEKIAGKQPVIILRQLFKKAGAVRDIQHLLVLLRKYEQRLHSEMPEFREFLERKMELKNNLLLDMPQTDWTMLFDNLSHMLSRAIDKLEDKQLYRRAKTLINKDIKKIRCVNDCMDNPEKLHRMRTRIKQTLFMLEVLLKYSPGCYDRSIVIKLKSMARVLGCWHDGTVLILHLDNFLVDYESHLKPSDRRYVELYQKVARENRSWLRKLSGYSLVRS